ncbi:MAG: hypothetical protein QXD13_01420 [Candidatus Pacearchaeota archaeon]
MTETIFFESTKNLIRALPELKKKLKVGIKVDGNKVEIEGPSLDEYEAKMVLDAINFGFPAKKALLLLNEGFIFRILNIKQFTRRRNLADIKARIIGTEGKTKRTIENVAGCAIMIRRHEVGIIGTAEAIETTTTAIISLIKGSKQANVYAFLEKMNAARKEKTDLGLKPSKEEQKKAEK